MTFNWFYLLSFDLFTVEKDLTKKEDVDFEIVLKIKRNIPESEIQKERHCYWAKECE